WFEDCTGADQIWLADNQTRAAWAWSFFIGALAARWTLGKRSAWLDFVMLAVATVLALLAPGPWTPLTAAAWLGLASGVIVVGVAESLPQPAAAAHKTAPMAAAAPSAA